MKTQMNRDETLLLRNNWKKIFIMYFYITY